MTLELVDKLLDLLTGIEHPEKSAQLQSLLTSKDQALHALQSDMTRQLDEKSSEICDLERQMRELQKQNLRLEEFSDAVRSTFMYRFYRNCLKPIGINVK